MKEFISILFMIVSGVILYGVFSTQNVDADSTALGPPGGQNLLYQCYGGLTVNGTASTIPISCSGETITQSQSCGTNQFLVGWTYQTTYTYEETFFNKHCDIWGNCSWNWEWENVPTGSACNAVCATMSAPVSNCGWH